MHKGSLSWQQVWGTSKVQEGQILPSQPDCPKCWLLFVAIIVRVQLSMSLYAIQILLCQTFLALIPLITDSYTPTHKQTDVHSMSPSGEMNKCSSGEKTTKDCQTVALEISFDHLSYENPNAKIRASRQMFCCVFSFLPVCGDICRAGLIEKALPSHSNSIACILCKRDDRWKIKK